MCCVYIGVRVVHYDVFLSVAIGIIVCLCVVVGCVLGYVCVHHVHVLCVFLCVCLHLYVPLLCCCVVWCT